MMNKADSFSAIKPLNNAVSRTKSLFLNNFIDLLRKSIPLGRVHIFNHNTASFPNSAMAPPLTFGVELEFALAYLPYDSIPLPDPDDAKKILHFTLTDEDWAQNEFDIPREEFLPIATQFAARRSVRNTIKEWEVVNDGSVRAPEGSPYEWTDIEMFVFY